MKNILKTLIILLAGFAVKAQGLAPDIANYQINVFLDNESKVLTGEEVLEWTNTSDVSVNEMHFHLYLNAFKDEESTFMKESGGKLRGKLMEEGGYGDIYLTSLSDQKGRSLLGSLKYIQPDDKNENDRTVATIQLEEAVLPGEKVTLNIGFRAKLPKVFARTGYGAGDYYLIGQWFPKVGVFEKDKSGQWAWNCHQFHEHTEFYADFGTYKVNITLPQKLIVGATGQLKNTTKLKGGMQTLTYEADDVHDFAWTASPDFVVHEETYKGIQLKAMMQPEHASQYRRYFTSVKHSIDYTEKLLGKYPHPILTMVDPPVHSSGSAGMEYPMFITCGSYWGVGSWLKLAEIVTVHEFGHQYFQGILASNEFEQSFLDEGFNQYLEGRIMDENYGEGSQVDFLGFKVGDTESSRASYVGMKFPELAEINRPAWEYPKGTYGAMTYTKTATVLKTLENYLGREVMDKALKLYYQRFKFKHPKLSDFQAVVNEVSPENMDWYFTQSFEKSYSCDYQVDSVYSSPEKSFLEIRNKGKFIMPQTIAIDFVDGSSEVVQWDGRGAFKSFSYDKEVNRVSLDPDRKNLMDLNMVNNSWIKAGPQQFLTKYTAKALFWFQILLTDFLTWIG
ncbi:M1 family metallopeptidase [Jiulongibacter sp. NS-SX5]|uniref:M1 family metallopeptidase n=1 Tax=Jiulongibacter sp. NS-SX5 TaxID=3463854 RepID=UPI00405984BE